MQSHDSYTDEVNMARSLFKSRVSGFICSLAMETKSTSHFDQFSANNIPLVFVDRVPKGYNTFRVVIDNYAAAYKAVKHLIDQGCRRIAHITTESEFGHLYNERKRGYVDAIVEHGLTFDDNLIITLKTMTYEEGVRASNKLFDLKPMPDGLFAPGDLLAVSAVQTAKKRGVKVPQDFAVIGFNNDPISEIIEPNISTITHPAEKMGSAAASIIIDNIEKRREDEAKEITFLNTEVLVRESSKKIQS
jgi:LacI family transcriptional regulator